MLQGNTLTIFCQVCDIMTPPLVEAAMSGFNGTLMAYGQTGSGAYGVLDIFLIVFCLSNFAFKNWVCISFHERIFHLVCTQNFLQNLPFPPPTYQGARNDSLFQRYNEVIKTEIEVALRLDPVSFPAEIVNEDTETYRLKNSS